MSTNAAVCFEGFFWAALHGVQGNGGNGMDVAFAQGRAGGSDFGGLGMERVASRTQFYRCARTVDELSLRQSNRPRCSFLTR